jgi:NAD(P)-dependent dehydrogenase (short-subunit alcohol dehydrogenase family)
MGTTAEGARVLVTAGAAGIGLAIARAFMAEGAAVYVCDIDADALAKLPSTAPGVKSGRCDMGDRAAIGSMVEAAVAALGGLDVLVNNAGVGVLGPLAELALPDVDRVLAVNVRGVFMASQAAAGRMPAGGRIITIGTCMTQRVPGPGGTLYAMSKSALVGLTKALARELGPRGITANLVHPGPIDTDMNPADGPYAAGQATMTALGRFGTAQEVAATVAHLAGAAYVTGAEFAVDGGHAA